MAKDLSSDLFQTAVAAVSSADDGAAAVAQGEACHNRQRPVEAPRLQASVDT